MALIAPVAFAAAGGLLTGGATWGMAAGWLIGSWLFNKNEDQKNQVFDPGAEEMPSFNQALRGATMPILFGTNRVSSNIVWQNAFTTIRKEKKSGGGGGKFKVGQPSSTEVTYEYKWDIMFHIGMSDVSVDLIGAWVGQEKVNGNTLVAIIANSDSSFATFTGLTGGDGVDLNFEDSYYHGAGATGDTIDNWAHFETVTGGGYRFPYTVYVGFKQLELGNTARVPQISWEVGEGGADLTVSGATIDGSLTTDGNYPPGGAGHPYAYFMRGNDGHLARIETGIRFSTPGVIGRHRNLDTGAQNGEMRTIQDLKDDFDAFWGGSFALSSTLAYNCVPIEDRYILYVRNTWPGVGGDKNFECLLYELVDGNGTVNCVGSARFGDPGLNSYWQSMAFYGIAGAGTDDDQILVTVSGGPGIGDDLFYLWSAPSINDFKNGVWYLDGADDIANAIVFIGNASLLNSTSMGRVTSIKTQNYTQLTGQSNEEVGRSRAFVVPKITIGLGLTYEDVYYVFVSRQECQWHLDNPGSGSAFIQTQAATYPNGFIAKITDLEWSHNSGVSIDFTGSLTGFTIVNDKFVDTSGAQVLPFEDDGYDEDDNNQINCSYSSIWIQNQRLRTGFGAGGNLVVFHKNYYDTSDWNRTANGPAHRCRVFIYNPITEVFTQFANVFGPIQDDILVDWDDGDWSSGFPALSSNDGVIDYGHVNGYWDDDTTQLLVAGTYTLGVNNGNVRRSFVGRIGNLNISGGTDITPPVIIYRILTNTVFGLGISENDIDTVSYGLANQYCEAEGIKVSAQYRREESALSIITQLLELYGGFLIDSGGKIKFGIQEFSSTTIRTIDNNHLRVDQEGEPPVLITKGARQDTYNRVKVNYFDRSLAYRQNFIEVADEVDMDVNGVRAQEFPAKFVMSEATARKMAVRALWGNMYARDIYDFKLGAKDADLEPGDVITLVDSYHSELQSGKQARIVTWQETEPLTFQVKAVEEVEYVSTSSLAPDSVTEASSNTLMARPQPMATFGMYELPAEFQGADAQLYVGYRQQFPIMGARLYLSADGVSYTLSDEVSPYIISGIIREPLPLRPPGFVEESVHVYLMPDQITSGAFNPNSPLYVQNHILDDVTPAARAAGLGNIWINSEMMAFEGVNLVGQNYYRLDKLYRGWGGTHIQGHSSGDTWWKQGGGVFTDTINVDQIGTLLYYKVTGYNFAGQEYNISSVVAKTYQIQGTHWRPQVQAPLATYVQSPGSYLTIQSEDLGGEIRKKKVISGGSPVQFEWAQSAQKAGWGAQGYGVGTYGRFTQDTTSVSYRVEVLSADYSTVVRCTTVNTTAFLYTTALNSEDWNGWTGSFAVRVTPFNPYGTALRSRTKILELFE